MRKYKYCCPAINCFNEDPTLVELVSVKNVKAIPRKIILGRVEEDAHIYRCKHCGFIWAQKRTKTVGLDPIPLGYFEGDKFQPVAENFPVKKENRSYYYYYH